MENAVLHNASVSKPSSSHPGLVQVFTGDGKGKTTAALGEALRALGQGLRVHIVFFMKGDYPYGERAILSQLPGVTITSFGQREFVDPACIKPAEKEEAGKALAAACEAVHSGKYDLVVLDEVNVAVAWKLVELDEVVRLVRDKPKDMELILTGRYADPALIEMADLVTEMVKIKHPFDRGVLARKGIDY